MQNIRKYIFCTKYILVADENCDFLFILLWNLVMKIAYARKFPYYWKYMTITWRGIDLSYASQKYTLSQNFKSRNIRNTLVWQFEIACNYLSLGNNGISAMKTWLNLAKSFILFNFVNLSTSCWRVFLAEFKLHELVNVMLTSFLGRIVILTSLTQCWRVF